VLIFISGSILSLSSQELIPDDLFFNPEVQVIPSDLARELHVSECIVTDGQGRERRIRYDANGHLLSIGEEYWFNLYDANGQITSTQIYTETAMIGLLSYTYNSEGQLLSVNKEYHGAYGQGKGTRTVDYEQGRVSQIVSTNIFDSILGEVSKKESLNYAYGTDGSVTIASKKEDLSMHSMDAILGENTFSRTFEDGRISKASQRGEELEITHDSKGRIIQLHKADGELLVAYTYEANGLLRSKQEGDEYFKYSYKYFEPTKLYLTVPKELTRAYVYKHGQNTEIFLREIVEGRAEIDLYTHNHDIYIIALTDNYKIPVIARSGVDIHMSVDQNSTSFSNDLVNNSLMFSIYDYQAAVNYQHPNDINSYMFPRLKKVVDEHQDYFGVLAYTNYMFLVYYENHYLDYTIRMLDQHPTSLLSWLAYYRVRE